MNKKRTLLYRSLSILVLLIIAATMMVIGRGHTVYFDNKALEYNGTSYEAPYKVEVTVNHQSVAKLYDGDRGMASWMGQNFKMMLEITQEKGGESVTREIALKLPYNMDGIILNIPALLSDLPEDAYLSEFIPVATEEADDEEVVTDEFAEFSDL